MNTDFTDYHKLIWTNLCNLCRKTSKIAPIVVEILAEIATDSGREVVKKQIVRF